jgi:hypothetical protein
MSMKISLITKLAFDGAYKMRNILLKKFCAGIDKLNKYFKVYIYIIFISLISPDEKILDFLKIHKFINPNVNNTFLNAEF